MENIQKRKVQMNYLDYMQQPAQKIVYFVSVYN